MRNNWEVKRPDSEGTVTVLKPEKEIRFRRNADGWILEVGRSGKSDACVFSPQEIDEARKLAAQAFLGHF